MAAVAAALGGDRYGASSTSSSASSSSSSSSSFSSSSGDTTEENSSSSWSSSCSSSTWSSSASSHISPSNKKRKRDGDNKKKKKKKKSNRKNRSKSTAVIARRKKKTKSSKSLVGRGVDHDDDNEVGSMLLLGAELLKEVEEAAATSAAAIATSTAAAAAAAAAALMDESRPAEPLLLPIGHYVVNGGPQNRTVLLEQVMSSVPAAQWQAILPPVLKEMNSAELKQLCLQQLQLLSDSAILNIINGGGDQGPAGQAVWSETATGETERCKKKKSKKSKKKKSRKSKKSERSRPTPDEGEEESSGKTLMELLELEMRARAIKALLKKEEEGEGDDEWPDGDLVASSFDVPLATAVGNVGRPNESSFSDKYKHQPSKARHSGHQHRSSVDPVPPANASQQPLMAAGRPSRRPASLHQQTDGADLNRRNRHSSAKQDDDQGLNQMRQPRHYRHRHHERSRSPVRRAEPSGVVAKTEETKHSAKSSSQPRRRC
ncbi:uncharacterized protein LOC123473958 [Daphnia magna]|uniref:uncharacterized protein LOC123473958 n=1 Tax=Daphnia magna TaxID=35525 RepID=UPI001E1BBE79|nr:uncharacterized protein LOC123473958 [Daphnia magna]XP_045031553.1 uncharacterized protein LOC123473958 [Daphnia magna]